MVTDSRELSGLRVLVVRPIRGDDDFAARLQDAGARIELCPVMSIEPLPGSVRNALAPAVARADDLILVSKPAAELAIELFRQHQIRPASLIAVGAATADVLRAAGYAVRYPQDPTSEGVLALPELQRVTGRQMVILRGDTGRDTMRDTLRARGATVDYGTLYRRVTISDHRREILHLLSQSAVDVVAIHSVAVLDSLLTLLDGQGLHSLKQLPVLVPGERVGLAVRAQGIKTVIEAASALPVDMVEGLRGWYTSR